MKLSRINTTLLAAVVAVNLYTIGVPLAPALQFWWETRTPTKVQAMQTKVALTAKNEYIPGPDTITIPSMLLDQTILEGPKHDMYKLLSQGIWHWPDSSTPDKGSNTVLLGHRLTYTNPRGVLYNLDKVRVGDTIGLVWQHKKYTYTVADIQTVPPTATQLVAPTKKSTLTIYTCTPLWKPHDRLVVTAELNEPEQKP